MNVSCSTSIFLVATLVFATRAGLMAAGDLIQQAVEFAGRLLRVILPPALAASVLLTVGCAPTSTSLRQGGTGGDDYLALTQAAGAGRLDIVQALVGKGVSINGRPTVTFNGQVMTYVGQEVPLDKFSLAVMNILVFGRPLVTAAAQGRLEIVEWLVDHGADVNIQEEALRFRDLRQTPGVTGDSRLEFRPVIVRGVGNSPMSVAILSDKPAVAGVLADHGADLSRRVVYRNASIPGLHGLGPGWIFDRGRLEPYDRLADAPNGFVSTNFVIQRDLE